MSDDTVDVTFSPEREGSDLPTFTDSMSESGELTIRNLLRTTCLSTILPQFQKHVSDSLPGASITFVNAGDGEEITDTTTTLAALWHEQSTGPDDESNAVDIFYSLQKNVKFSPSDNGAFVQSLHVLPLDLDGYFHATTTFQTLVSNFSEGYANALVGEFKDATVKLTINGERPHATETISSVRERLSIDPFTPLEVKYLVTGKGASSSSAKSSGGANDMVELRIVPMSACMPESHSFIVKVMQSGQSPTITTKQDAANAFAISLGSSMTPIRNPSCVKTWSTFTTRMPTAPPLSSRISTNLLRCCMKRRAGPGALRSVTR